jgi:hypothetical protein
MITPDHWDDLPLAEVDAFLATGLGLLEHIHDHVQRKQFRRWRAAPIEPETVERSEVIPW